MATVKRRPAKKAKPQPKHDDNGGGGYYSRAVAKALEILEILSNAREPLSLGDLTAALKLTKASVFRLLFTLEQTGYIRKLDDGRHVVAHDIRRGMMDRLGEMLLRVARPIIRDLHASSARPPASRCCS